MLKLFIALAALSILNGCTVVGILVDGYAQPNMQQRAEKHYTASTQGDPGKSSYTPTDNDGFSFAKLGLAIDSAVLGALQKPTPSKSNKECKKLSETITECDLVAPMQSSAPSEPQSELEAIERRHHE